jgi:hypothetical protein
MRRRASLVSRRRKPSAPTHSQDKPVGADSKINLNSASFFAISASTRLRAVMSSFAAPRSRSGAAP